MRRRDFVTLAAAAVAAPLPVVGFLHPGFPTYPGGAGRDLNIVGLKDGPRERGPAWSVAARFRPLGSRGSQQSCALTVPWFSASRISLLALNLGTRFAATGTRWPVRGLRPTRERRSFAEKASKPRI
jgi:hypothetical protein